VKYCEDLRKGVLFGNNFAYHCEKRQTYLLLLFPGQRYGDATTDHKEEKYSICTIKANT